MAEEFAGAFNALRAVLAGYADRLMVKTDTPDEYLLVSKSASPYPQHKGEPLQFASVRRGKAYVSFHLLPLYMHPTLPKSISPGLKRRMQGKSCFNFSAPPEPDVLDELRRLTQAAFEAFEKMK